MSNFIHGIHDPDLDYLMDSKPGWIVFTEAIGCEAHNYSGGDYRRWTAAGFGVIVRLNNGYGSTGTIPGPEEYAAFAQRCANYVGASPGCDRVIIGNEPNHANERPGGQIITPTQYAKCYDLAYKAIKAANPAVQVAPAPSAPWDATTTYEGNRTGDWIQYWEEVLLMISKADFLVLHTYTHGDDPALITDESKMDRPYDEYMFQFRHYRDYIRVIPNWYWGLPIYITETDQIIPWTDANTGWVQAAYAEIDHWNHSHNPNKIDALCLYRASRDDQWTFTDKEGVKVDFREAVARGYRRVNSPSPGPGPTPPPIDPPQPPIDPGYPGGFPPPEARHIDPALIARGVNFHFVSVPPGTGYWRVTNAMWLDEDEADAVGPDRHILGTIIRDHIQEGSIPLDVTWPSGETLVYSKEDDPNATYNYNFPMSASLNEFSIMVADGWPSDKVTGIGMGKDGNPGIHTSTWIDFEWTIAEAVRPEPPKPQPPLLGIVHPLLGATITQHFGQALEDYSRFSLWGHNGVDFGGKREGSPVACFAAGVVVFSAYDEGGYGNYVRVAHDALGCYSFYAHLSEPGAAVGTVLAAGQQVGLVGSTGNSSGAHLHFEIRLCNKDGSYKVGTPMIQGRCCPETFCIMHGLQL